MTTSTQINGDSTMQEVLAAFPGARRALFRRYHIGGCSSCGFESTETLAQVCQRNGKLEVTEVIAQIESGHQQDKQMEITAPDLAAARLRGEVARLLDVRTREEWDATRLDGAEFVNQELVQSLMSKSPRDAVLVFYDHDGKASLDAAAYFVGHGFTNAKYLRGGIDAWSVEVDPKIPRYRLENT